MATRKKQPAARQGSKRAAGSRKKASAQTEQEIGSIRGEAMIILSFALAALLFLSNFRLCGIVGDALRAVQLGMFGCMGYALPLFVFVGTAFYVSNIGNFTAVKKLSAAAAAMVAICGFAHLIFGVESEEGIRLMECYRYSSENGAGGGLIGGALCKALMSVIGTAGCVLALLVLFIISAVCVTNRSFVRAVSRRGGRVYQYARSDIERQREIRAQRQEERRRSLQEMNRLSESLPAGGTNSGRAEMPESSGISQRSVEEAGGNARKRGKYAPNAEREPLNAKERPLSKEDIFTGEITVAPRYTDESELSFEENPALSAAQSAQRLVEEGAARFAAGGADAFLRGEPPDALQMPGTLETTEESWQEGLPEVFDEETAIKDTAIKDTTIKDTAIKDTAINETSIDQTAIEEAQADKVKMPGMPVKTGYAQHNSFADDCAAEKYSPEISSRPGESYAAIDGEEEIYLGDPIAAGQAGAGRKSQDDGYMKTTSRGNEFYVPGSARRVETAGGKIIETDTEVLKKKLETRRQEIRERNGEAEVRAGAAAMDKSRKEYQFPPLSLLKGGIPSANKNFEQECRETAIRLQQTLKTFGVGVTVTNISCGPTVTRYELHPEMGVKVSRIVGLSDDIKLSLAAADIRIEAPIPGKSAVGIEVPNKENSIVYLRELLEAENFQNHPSRLAFAVGKDIGGQVVVADIAKMPHLLIAGATGAGKSVCINTLIMSIIYKSKPEDVRLILVDPKVVELSIYNGVPHLLIPVVTDPKKAAGALNWAVAEMTDRYKKFAKCSVRDLKGYNARAEAARAAGSPEAPEKLPQIVIIIDELADLMMVASGEVEDAICRLAQLARACGIHLVIATQRPSVNVITGLIKANIPSRIAFSVSSGTDSRTILDMVGAEKLLGKGDMLFYPAGIPKPQRVQGAYVSDQEVQAVVEFLTQQGVGADYNAEIEMQVQAGAVSPAEDVKDSHDEYFYEAGKFIIEKEKASIGMLQRMFKIGFNRAARIMDQLAQAGVVGEEEGTKPRKILMSMDEFEEMLGHGGGMA